MIESFHLGVEDGIRKAAEIGADYFTGVLTIEREVGDQSIKDIKEAITYLRPL